MDWRQPSDNFARLLDAARERVLANTIDPWHAVEPFEPVIEALHSIPASRADKLPRVHAFGRDLFEELRSSGHPIAMEVRHYCWYLQYLGAPKDTPVVSVKDLLMVTLTRFAHFAGHGAGRCSICADFPDDLPYQGGAARGRAHFDEWIKRKSGEGTASP